ncbi:hypothetical protein [Streptomyces yaizuensis]|uniref:DUF4244 domain-containing protein n=1 Tax=Streptomyces yaizuensis TaxID=2989713 RepID=A0ABQ5NVL0_9ACTN|nr:hypothetical protein [Streptomyces sp. YSPA8]GLF94382.1 hypothetical protein SYYSPA8_08815 [Streptomyces sp. YSPA8]
MSNVTQKAVAKARRYGAARMAAVARSMRERRDAGQDSVEYVGVIVLVAAIIAALVGSGVADDIANGLRSQISDILSSGGGGE